MVAIKCELRASRHLSSQQILDLIHWFSWLFKFYLFIAEADIPQKQLDIDDVYDLVLLANTPAQPNPSCIALHVNANETGCMCFKRGAIPTLSGRPLKLVDQFAYLSSNISSSESDITLCLVKALTANDRLSIFYGRLIYPIK